jgi:alpha-tubulin suppressor-like RCC1 family protein
MSKLYACNKNDYYQYGSKQGASSETYIVNVVANNNALKDKVIKEITCGINYGFVITSENELYGFGNNPNYNLGFDNSTEKVVPQKITGTWKSVFANNNTARLFTFFIDDNDKLYAAGDNTNKNLSIKTTTNNNVLTACQYQNDIEVFCKNITCNDYYSVIINNADEVYWCGTMLNKEPEKFFKKITFPETLPFSGTIKQVCINSGQITNLFLLTNDGVVYSVNATDAFTDNFAQTYTFNFGDEKVVKLSICNNNLAALTEQENIYVWGSNGYGFGVKSYQVINTNTDPTKIIPEVDYPNKPSDIKFIDVIAGYNYSLALTNNNLIYSCGRNYNIGNSSIKTNFFYQIYLYGKIGNNTLTSKIALGYDTFLAISQDNAACFNEGTKILCLNCKLDGELNCKLNGELQEIYRPVQDLQVGDFVKSYLHGYRKVNKILTGSFGNNPTEDGVSNCMYRMVKTNDNGLIDDLILTRNHGFLVEKLSENEEKKVDKNTLPIIDNLLSIITADSDKFEKVIDNNVYNYYHFSLETDGDNDRRFGVYANGLLVEIPSINMMDNALNIKPLDF